ncbi:MAG TPA: hypothetical protein VF736_21110 [Pyrinomonadaceae bacterium]|jgi:hypothetical protein
MTGEGGGGETQVGEIIARLLGTTVAELRDDPEAVRARLAGLFGRAAGAGASESAEALREFVRRMRAELAGRGIATPEGLDELPERLEQLYALLQTGTPEEAASRLRQLAGLIESPGAEGVELEDVAAWLETNLGPLLGSEQARRRREEKLRAEYTAAAKRSIAEALREVGIEPLSTGDVPEETARGINRQRFFWREFSRSESEVRRLLASGRAEEARALVAELLEGYDLGADFDLALEGEEAVLSFPTPDDLDEAVRLQVVIRDSPRLPGWRISRAPRRAPNRAQ